MLGFGTRWDAFISYKSEDVGVAREVADLLVASRRRVWFAEQQVLLHDRALFQQSIDEGTRKSRYGIAFTSDEYSESTHCQREMAQLLRHCGATKILEVRMSSGRQVLRRFSTLNDSPFIRYTGDLSDVLGFISRTTGWALQEPAKEPACKAVAGAEAFSGHPFRIDTSGWRLVSPSFHGGGPCFGRTLGKSELLFNVQYGKESDPMVYDARRAKRSERDYYNELCDYARGYFGFKKPARVHGVHLYFAGGASQFGVTYHDGIHWKRRISLVLLHPRTYQATEFLFTFQFDGPLEEYCRYAGLMDRTALSLSWADDANPSSEQHTAAPSTHPKRFVRLQEDLPAVNKLYDAGLHALKQGALVEGIEILTGILPYSMLQEEHGAILFNIGLAHERLGRHDLAIECYEQSYSIHPNSNACCNLGSLLYKEGRIAEALTWSLKALELDPSDRLAANNAELCRRTQTVSQGAGAGAEKKSGTEIPEGKLTCPEHYAKVKVSAPGGPISVTLTRAASAGQHIELVYNWHEQLAHRDADNLDTRVRAYVACAIYDAAVAAGLACQPGPPHGQRPSWIVADCEFPITLVQAGFDMAEKICWLHIGRGIRRHDDAGANLTAINEQLSDGFRRSFGAFVV